MNNFMQFMNLCQQMSASGNPAKFISQKFGVNIPENVTSSSEAMQYFLNNGTFNQAQVNNAMQLQNDPGFKRVFGIN